MEMWEEDCEVAIDYYSYMEDMLVEHDDNNTYVTIDRLINKF